MSPSTTELEKQYDRVLQEYRFQVQLNWDRAKHYLVFNTTLIAGAAVLYNNAEQRAVPHLAVAILLLLSCRNSVIGARAVDRGQNYYREIRGTKAALEAVLNLQQYAILSTPGMKRDHDAVPAGTPESGASRGSQVAAELMQLLRLIALIAGIAGGAALITSICYLIRAF